MKNHIKTLLAAVFSGFLLFSGCGNSGEVVYETAESISSGEEESAGSVRDGEPQELQEQVPEEDTVFVYVCGAVEHPGVYELPAGSRVYQAIEAAGGLSAGTDARCLNQAQLLEDGQQITVYTLEETAAMEQAGQSILPPDGGEGSAGQENGSASGKVNINTAGKEELMTLPGIGEARAEAIMEYRETAGGFSAPEEIMEVSGIKEKAFEKIKDCIEV